MSRYNWSLLSLVFVILAPPITGAAAVTPSAVVAKHHGKVELPCAGLKNTPCSAISWTFRKQKRSDSVVLLQDRRFVNKIKLPLLSLEPDCSMSISAVTERHVGLFSCSRSADHTPLHTVSLSVVRASERNNCSLSSAEPDRFTLVTRSEVVPNTKWEVPPLLKFEIKDLILHCDVFDRLTRKTWNLHLSDFYKVTGHRDQTQAPNVTTIVPDVTSAPNTAAPSADGFRYKHVLYAVIAVFSAALLTLVCVTVLCWRHKANLSQSDNCHAEEELHYATVHFEKTPNRGTKAEGEEDLNTTVVYSAVRTAPPVQTDPSALYATVNKPKKASG